MTPRLKWVFAKAATVYKGQRETPRYEEVVSSSDRIVVHRFHGSLGSVRHIGQPVYAEQRPERKHRRAEQRLDGQRIRQRIHHG